MTEFDLSPHALRLLQRVLRSDEKPAEVYDRLCIDYTSAIDKGDYAHASLLAEQARALVEFTMACPVCGDAECSSDIAYIGDGHMMHEHEHPESRTERAMEERHHRGSGR